jgi:predicted nucleotide-binding protein
MARSEIKALSDFMKAARNQPQSAIIKEFLATIIKGKHICESGSVLVDRPLRGKLELFNDNDFLIKEGFLEKGQPWSKEFDYFDGIAGLAYRTKAIQVVDDAQNDPKFSERDGDVPIANMVCAPILLSDSRKSRPFGVASFHNSQPNPKFSDDDVTLIEAYTDTLGLMLEISQYNLECERSTRVFIVHGHDRVPLLQLENLLLSLRIEPVVMKEQPKTGQELLEMLEQLIEGCRGGFVLMTPDDVGRKKPPPDTELSPRARENVIFESGILTSLFRANKKVCFLVKKPLDLPSDMHGLLYEEIGEEIDQKRIERILTSWGMLP